MENGKVGADWISKTFYGRRAKALTGKVPKYFTFTGTAKKRNSESGSASRLQRCSTIGISAPSSNEWRTSPCTGIVDVKRIDAHESGARVYEKLSRLGGEEGMSAISIFLSAPVTIPSRVK